MAGFFLGIFTLLSIVLITVSSFILSFELYEDKITKTRVKCCLVCSIVLLAGCFIVAYNKDDSEYIEHVETRLKKCIERFPEHQDRCVISVTK